MKSGYNLLQLVDITCNALPHGHVWLTNSVKLTNYQFCQFNPWRCSVLCIGTERNRTEHRTEHQITVETLILDVLTSRTLAETLVVKAYGRCNGQQRYLLTNVALTHFCSDHRPDIPGFADLLGNEEHNYGKIGSSSACSPMENWPIPVGWTRRWTSYNLKTANCLQKLTVHVAIQQA